VSDRIPSDILKFKPSDEFIIGLALDMSGSMKNSIRSAQQGSRTKLESLWRCLHSTFGDLGRLSDQAELKYRIFVYGFGLRAGEGVVDLLSLLAAIEGYAVGKTTTKEAVPEVTRSVECPTPRAHQQSQRGILEVFLDSGMYILNGIAKKAQEKTEQHADGIRAGKFDAPVDKGSDSQGGLSSLLTHVAVSFLADRFATRLKEHFEAQNLQFLWGRIDEIGDSLWTPDQVASRFDATKSAFSLEDAEPILYGATPLSNAATIILQRLNRIPSKGRKVLFVVSDGEPTDGDPRPAFASIAEQGVEIVSCFLNDASVVDPRRLYSQPDPEWCSGARLMFDISTNIAGSGPIASSLTSRGWILDASSKLFVQLNHEDILEEFMASAIRGH
jgi:hypothetical protein